MPERLVTIGHIVEDTAQPENVIGGGVTYSGLMAKELGLDVGIITKIPPTHRFLTDLKDRGIGIHTLPTESSTTTTFTNTYDESGNRRQLLLGRQETITKGEIEGVPMVELKPSFILVAPVIAEVGTDAIPLLAKAGPVAVTPQGYFREAGVDGTIFQKEWSGFEEDLSHASLTSLSVEDISVGDIVNENLPERIIYSSPIVLLTKGELGATVYLNALEYSDIKAFPLSKSYDKDFTGAGDTFASAFISKFIKNGDIHEAAVFAALIAAIKISGTSGRGTCSIPNRDQIDQFIDQHYQEVRKFLAENDASENSLDY